MQADLPQSDLELEEPITEINLPGISRQIGLSGMAAQSNIGDISMTRTVNDAPAMANSIDYHIRNSGYSGIQGCAADAGPSIGNFASDLRAVATPGIICRKYQKCRFVPAVR
ncbi:MAG: hypothetical protein ACLU77_15110 [Waltera sp.]